MIKRDFSAFCALLCAVVSACAFTQPPFAQQGYAPMPQSAIIWCLRGAAEDKIDLNTATQAQLCTLPGIGQKRAESVLLYRAAYKEFATVDALEQVEGISHKTVDALRARVCVNAKE